LEIANILTNQLTEDANEDTDMKVRQLPVNSPQKWTPTLTQVNQKAMTMTKSKQ